MQKSISQYNRYISIKTVVAKKQQRPELRRRAIIKRMGPEYANIGFFMPPPRLVAHPV